MEYVPKKMMRIIEAISRNPIQNSNGSRMLSTTGLILSSMVLLTPINGICDTKRSDGYSGESSGAGKAFTSSVAGVFIAGRMNGDIALHITDVADRAGRQNGTVDGQYEGSGKRNTNNHRVHIGSAASVTITNGMIMSEGATGSFPNLCGRVSGQ